MTCVLHPMRLCLPIIMLLALAVAAPTRALAKDGVETAGDILRFAMPAMAGGFSLLRGDKEGAVQLVKSVALSSALAFGLQQGINSPRPDASGNDSFPSGHAVNAFSAAAYMDHRYGWKYGLPSYLAAAFVGYSRIHEDKHDLKDVAVGALLGWGVSHIFVTPLPIRAGAEVGHNGALLRISATW